MENEKEYSNQNSNCPGSIRLPMDLTFIVNEPGKTLRERFNELIKDSRFFDCLVAYFYISGFDTIYKSLQETERIGILILVLRVEERNKSFRKG